MIETFISISPAYIIFLSGVLTPGPANLLIMSVSADKGKAIGLAIAMGVICGSITWAIFSVLGIKTLISAYPELLIVIRIFGICFLLWLSYKAVRNAMTSKIASNNITRKIDTTGKFKVFLQGYAVHITNPKALIVWTTIISVGVPPNSSPIVPYLIVLGCSILGIIVFSGYALLFSTNKMTTAFKKLRIPINWLVAIIFFLIAIFSLSKLF